MARNLDWEKTSSDPEAYIHSNGKCGLLRKEGSLWHLFMIHAANSGTRMAEYSCENPPFEEAGKKIAEIIGMRSTARWEEGIVHGVPGDPGMVVIPGGK